MQGGNPPEPSHLAEEGTLPGHRVKSRFRVACYGHPGSIAMDATNVYVTRGI